MLQRRGAPKPSTVTPPTKRRTSSACAASEGQVRGIARMVDEDKYCIDILTQVAAVSKALHAVSLNLLEEHIGHCVTGAAVESERTGDPTIAEAKVKEATAAISRLMRS